MDEEGKGGWDVRVKGLMYHVNWLSLSCETTKVSKGVT